MLAHLATASDALSNTQAVGAPMLLVLRLLAGNSLLELIFLELSMLTGCRIASSSAAVTGCRIASTSAAVLEACQQLTHYIASIPRWRPPPVAADSVANCPSCCAEGSCNFVPAGGVGSTAVTLCMVQVKPLRCCIHISRVDPAFEACLAAAFADMQFSRRCAAPELPMPFYPADAAAVLAPDLS